LWKRWWFVLLAGLLIASGLFFTIRERERRLQRVNLLQKQQVESQYEALKSQINPHFLFNSFNTLIAMIEETPEDAVIYTEKLSDLFRNVLQYRDRESIPISEELELLDNYAFLLNKRFGDKMNLQIEVPPEDIRIVPLSLQLLVENAVKHNVVSTEKPLQVDVFFDQKNGWVGVSNLLQPKMRKEKSTGFGLQSLADRYAMLTSRKIKI
jgi:LytS/YehU family sensor histidine kinase